MIVKILDLDCALQQHEKEDSQQKGKTSIMIVNTPESQVVSPAAEERGEKAVGGRGEENRVCSS